MALLVRRGEGGELSEEGLGEERLVDMFIWPRFCFVSSR